MFYFNKMPGQFSNYDKTFSILGGLGSLLGVIGSGLGYANKFCIISETIPGIGAGANALKFIKDGYNLTNDIYTDTTNHNKVDGRRAMDYVEDGLNIASDLTGIASLAFPPLGVVSGGLSIGSKALNKALDVYDIEKLYENGLISKELRDGKFLMEGLDPLDIGDKIESGIDTFVHQVTGNEDFSVEPYVNILETIIGKKIEDTKEKWNSAVKDKIDTAAGIDKEINKGGEDLKPIIEDVFSNATHKIFGRKGK
jgi:hypothetical protein